MRGAAVSLVEVARGGERVLSFFFFEKKKNPFSSLFSFCFLVRAGENCSFPPLHFEGRRSPLSSLRDGPRRPGAKLSERGGSVVPAPAAARNLDDGPRSADD